MNKQNIALALLIGATLMRLVPHYPNVTPLCAIGLFGAATLGNRWKAFAVPFAALFLSDLVLNNIVYKSYYTQFQWYTSGWMYLALAGVVVTGMICLRQISVRNVILASVIGSLVFYLLSNIWPWQTSPMYTKDFKGLMMAYTNGLEFLRNSLLGDLFYCAVLFGTYYFAVPKLSPAAYTKNHIQ